MESESEHARLDAENAQLTSELNARVSYIIFYVHINRQYLHSI